MDQSAEVLFKLIRIALGNEENLSLPNVVNWQEVFDLANRQGVDALVWTDMLSERSEEFGIDEYIKYKWIGHQAIVEKEYYSRLQSLKNLGLLWATKRITPVVLKGLTYAVLYPKPYHRKSCDLDVFLFDRWEDGNLVVEGEGIEVNRDYYKNSSFTYYGLFVENHRYCTSIRGRVQRKRYELFLQGLLEKSGLEKIVETDFYTPPPLFNILFFLSHAQEHFLYEGGIQLKHVCDWSVIMKAYANGDDDLWDEVIYYCEQFGFIRFMYSISQVAQRVCGVIIPFAYPNNDEAHKALLKEILYPTCEQVEFSSGLKAKKQLVKTIVQSRWKFKLFSKQSMLVSLLQTILFYLFEKEPVLKRE